MKGNNIRKQAQKRRKHKQLEFCIIENRKFWISFYEIFLVDYRSIPYNCFLRCAIESRLLYCNGRAGSFPPRLI